MEGDLFPNIEITLDEMQAREDYLEFGIRNLSPEEIELAESAMKKALQILTAGKLELAGIQANLDQLRAKENEEKSKS